MAYPTEALAFACASTLVITTLVAQVIGSFKFPLPAADRRIGCLDGLRGYLALLVLCGHALIWVQIVLLHGGWTSPQIPLFSALGADAVPLFFMTTGMVFYPKVLKGFVGGNWLGVYVTRVFRIIPMVAVSFCAVSVIASVIPGPKNFNFVHYIIQAFKWLFCIEESPIFDVSDSGRINAYVLWSLSYEWIFYIILLPSSALLMDVLIFKKLPSFIVPVIFICLSFIIRYFLHFHFLQYFPLFGMGMLAYEIHLIESIRRIIASSWFSCIALIALILSGLRSQLPLSLDNLLLIGVFFSAIACGNSLWGILRLRGALVLGECSYSIYVLHGVVLFSVFGIYPPLIFHIQNTLLPMSIISIAIGVLLLTILTYVFIERPMISAGYVLAKRITRKSSGMTETMLESAP